MKIARLDKSQGFFSSWTTNHLGAVKIIRNRGWY